MSNVRRGRGHYHESAAEVRAGYNGQTVPSTPPAYAGADKATDKQVKYLVSLMEREGLELIEGPADNVAKRTASVLIDNIVQRQKARKEGKTIPGLHPDFRIIRNPDTRPTETERKPFPKVPAGHYATTSATGDNDLDFWRADVPEDGRWAGYVFVKRVIGGRPSQSVKAGTARAALETIIKEGIDKVGVLYGQKIGRCRTCNRHLTDEISRLIGEGPDCRAANGR